MQPDIALSIGFENPQKAGSVLDSLGGKIKGFAGGGSSALAGLAKGFGAVAIAAAALGAIKKILTESIAAFTEYEDALKSLQSITGVGAEGLTFFGDAAKRLAIDSNIAAADTLKAFELIGSAQPSLLKSEKALVAVTESAITLAKASGLTLPEAATALTDAMNQFGASARDADKFINVLAAGSLEGAAAIPQVTQALVKFGSVAKLANVSIEEATAGIEVFAAAGLKGAEAGTGFRNVLLRLSAADALPKEALSRLNAAGVDLNVLKDTSISLADRLDELGKVNGDATALVKIFGAENLVAGQTLLDNTDKLRNLTKAVTGTSTAYEQAATRTQTLSESFGKLGQIINVTFIEIGAAIAPFAQALTAGIGKAFLAIKEVVIPMIQTLSEFGQQLGGLIGDLTGAGTEGDLFSIVLQGLKFSINTILLPFKLMVKGITQLVKWYRAGRDAVIKFLDKLGPMGDILKALLSPLSAAFSAVSKVVGAFKKFIGVSEEAEPTIQDAIKGFGGMGGAVEAFATSTGASTGAIVAFKDQLDLTKFANLALKDATILLREEYEKFAATLTKMPDAFGNIEEDNTGRLQQIRNEIEALKEIQESSFFDDEIRATTIEIDKLQKELSSLTTVAAKVKINPGPIVGSIDAVSAALSKLQAKFSASGPDGEKGLLSDQIALTKAELGRLNFDEVTSKITEDSSRFITDLGGVMTDAAALPIRAAADMTEVITQTASNSMSLYLADQKAQLESFKDSVKQNVFDTLVDGAATFAFSIGQAIGGVGDAISAYMAVVELLLVQVPRMVGIAMINQAATVPSPASLPLALAGLALVGLSGIASGVLGSQQERIGAAANSATGQGGSAPAPAQVAGLSSFGAGDRGIDNTVNVYLDGEQIQNAFTNVFENGRETSARR